MIYIFYGYRYELCFVFNVIVIVIEKEKFICMNNKLNCIKNLLVCILNIDKVILCVFWFNLRIKKVNEFCLLKNCIVLN